MNHTTNYGGRYVLPSIEERTNNGIKVTDPYSALFEARIIFLIAPIDSVSANDIVVQLLALDHKSSEDISLYIDCPGGSVKGAAQIINTIAQLKSDVSTLCMAEASESAALILAAGAKGKRSALPDSRVKLLEPGVYSPASEQQTNIERRVAKGEDEHEWMLKYLERYSNRDRDTITKDISRELWFTPEEALDYGLIDEIRPDSKA